MDEMTLEDYLAKYGGKEKVRPARSRPASSGGGGSSTADAVDTLLGQIRMVGLPAPQQEVLFHPTRKWRFDLAWVNEGIAVEVDGGIWMKTKEGYSKGHAHPKRFINDLEKINEAQLQGWFVYRFTPKMVRDGKAIDWLQRAFAQLEDG